MTHCIAQNVGVDISKDWLDVHLHPDGACRRFGNDPAGHKALLKWLGGWTVERIAYEATGAYHRALEQAGRALPLVKLNPKRARRFAEATGTLAKTDRVDAAMLARMAATLKPAIRPVKSKALVELSELMTARQGLVKDRTAVANRGKNLTLPLLKRHNEQRRVQIVKQIEAIDDAATALVNANPELARRRDIITSIKGLGTTTANQIIAGMDELGALESKQAASLAGLAPATRQSGNWRGKSFIQGGRANIRQALYMPALVASRFNPDLKAKYQQLIKAGKPAKVAITAIMRKLIVLANALLKADRLWQPNHA
ncbi:MAG: IS110 family transposase [Pseudomonadota bacterium]